MFIKTIVKTDKKTGKRYDYYRLCEGYRLGNKVRHRPILSLGRLEGVVSKEDKKILADRIEALLKGETALFAFDVPLVIEQYAQAASKRIIDEKLLDINPLTNPKPPSQDVDYEHINLDSIVHEQVVELGSEWLCKQTIDKLSLAIFLKETCLFSAEQADIAVMHIISRAVYPASEHKTAQWVQTNSAVAELCGIEPRKAHRDKLYDISRKLYTAKDKIEQFLSTKTNELFDLQDRIIFYDLTNTYFEGRKDDSKIARFGRSKEKRSDAKIVALAAVINPEGFLKYSKIYQGNMADVKTLETTIAELSARTSQTLRNPIIVMDAGISSEDNLSMLREKQYDYICVSRSKLKDYQSVNAKGTKTIVYDKRNHPIEIEIVKTETTEDAYLYVRSEQKAIKEASMDSHFSQHYEQALDQINQSLHKKGGTKKIDKVWERIGRLKERYPTANKHYNISVGTDAQKTIAINLKWSKIAPKTQSGEGVYFIRTSLDGQQETTLWTIYNTLTEIEATFRTLKTDLSLRPVFHKKDENTEAHLFLGLLAYQVVATVRYQLKMHNIKHDWQNIVRIMNTQKLVTSSMNTKDGKFITIKKSSKPNVQVQEIYQTLKYKQQPYTMKKSVVPEN